MSDIRLETGETKPRSKIQVGDRVRLEGGEAVAVGSLKGLEDTRLQGGETQQFALIS